MSSGRFRLVFTLLLALAAPLATSSQTLPPSTNDRQTITYLEYELTQPGVTSQQRQVIEQQISHLQYQINTRPLITAPPNGSPPVPLIPQNGRVPAMYTTSIPIEPYHYKGYGSCDADREMIEYLQAELKDPSITYQEQTYIPQQINELEHDMKLRHC